LFLLTDLTAFALALTAAIIYMFAVHARIGDPGATLTRLAVETFGVFLGVVICCGIQGHYQRRLSFGAEARQLVIVSAVALTGTGFVAFWTNFSLPRGPVALVWIAFPVLALGLRETTRLALNALGLWQRRALVVGDDETTRCALAPLLSRLRLGYEITKVVEPSVLETFYATKQLPQILERFDAHILILAADPTDWPRRAVLQTLIHARIPFVVMREMDGLPVLGCEQTSFLSHDIVMMSYRNNLAKPVARLIKVGLDLVLASIGLVVLSPLLLIIAALVKLDGGPVLFAHKRIGSDGIAFRCLKFRTMVPNASQVLQELLERDPDAAEEWVNTQKLRNDPRITRVGAWLRKASLDELPQLLNVLRLEMSLVGPRPIVEAEAAKYGDDFAFYCETRPGITGLWQVSGRSDTTYAYRVQLDCWYVKNWTVWNDLAIIARTVPTVLTRRGAV
jgi:undecaprenyl-phosphate galactose phosphotransferase